MIVRYAKMAAVARDWTVYVQGTLTGAQTIPATLTTANAKSITIKGATGTIDGSNPESAEPADVLDGEFTATATGKTLSIETTVPVTLKNLKITGGYTTGYEFGGGIYIATNGNVTTENVLITENNGGFGGGVYVGSSATFSMASGTVITGNVAVYNVGTVFMYGSAVIGDKTATASATYNAASASDVADSSYSNFASQTGGGIYSSGNIYLGYSDENTKAALTGGIYHNYADTQGGGIYLEAWYSVYMDSGEIAYNTAGQQGSGIWTGIGNTDTACGLFVSGSASVSAENDVYLNSSYNGTTYYSYVYIAGALSKSSVATVTPSGYGSQAVLKLADGAGTTLETEYAKFAVTQQNGGTGTWSITNAGELLFTSN